MRTTANVSSLLNSWKQKGSL